MMKTLHFVSAWEYKGEPSDAVLHKEELNLTNIELKQSYTIRKIMKLTLKIWRQKGKRKGKIG